MIDPALSVAFSVHSNPGVYALLLGSGVSRASGIPTGYEIILSLIERVVRVSGEVVARSDLEQWYQQKFGIAPKYGELLNGLAKTSAERNMLLRQFFEPSEDGRESGDKAPTPAHHAVAQLVADGFIRVVITTNFDRLLEQSLEQLAVVPTVIASPDAIRGAFPLAHSRCTIIKVHGDYLDARIKNTPEELERYDRSLNRLLDQVFDEYGLIVCGWSADWDVALRAALDRTRNYRFTTYWTSRGDPSPSALDVIRRRRAQLIPIESADTFFQGLGEKVISLRELDRPHPVTSLIAVQTLKRYLPNPEHRIRLHDLVFAEVQQISEALRADEFSANGPWSEEEFRRRVERLEMLSSTLAALVAAAGYHGDESNDHLWLEVVRRLYVVGGNLTSGITVFIYLRLYPALLTLYAVSIAALAARNYRLVGRLFQMVVASERNNANGPLVLSLNTHAVIEKNAGQLLPGMGGRSTPVSEHLQAILKETLLPYIGDASTYDALFDRFEYLLFLAHGAESKSDYRGRWGPIGSFGWRNRSANKSVVGIISKELESQGADWPPLKDGVLRGDFEAVQQLKKEMDEIFYRTVTGWY